MKIKILCITLVFILSFSGYAIASEDINDSLQNDHEMVKIFLKNTEIKSTPSDEDIDPLVDLKITVTIKEIRAFDKIDIIGDPDLYVKVFINEIKNTSPVWQNQKYVKPNWSATQNVPDDQEYVNIKIQLWDKNKGKDKLCDISSNPQEDPLSYDIDLYYNLKTGHWDGDDYLYPTSQVLFDPSGYGRLNGCDDNSIYQNDRDCEIWFDISQNDYDGDGIPYWTEFNIFNTDPTFDDGGRDDDGDGVPLDWEYKWGYYMSYNHSADQIEHKWIYDPFKWENHPSFDPDEDGLDNIEEYYTSQWGSDPFRKDIFLEIDQMQLGPNEEGGFVPEGSKDLLIDAFSKHNIAFHIDDGCMGGGELLTFDNSTTDQELRDLYFNYFLDGNTNYWRRGAFHYALVIYHSEFFPGFVFRTTADGKNYSIDSLQISTKQHEKLPNKNYLYDSIRRKTFNREKQREIVYAGAIMHETGHTLGIYSWNVPGCDNSNSVFPNKDWFKFRNYRSCMNYNLVYTLIDYSDGSHGINDHDDWATIDLTLFQKGSMWH